MKVLRMIALFLGAWMSYSVSAQSVYPGQHGEKITASLSGETKVCSFDLSDVRLLDSPFRQNMERTAAWLLSFDADRLLHSFRTTAGVYAGSEGGYYTVKKLGGWESLDCELRGHSTGHIMSALAYLYASTGEDVYKAKADSLVTGLKEVQDVLEGHGGRGFLGAWPENLIDRNIAGQRVWAPWYTQHKIYAGLIDQYLCCDNADALDIACRMAGWAHLKLSPLTEEQRKLMLRNEFGGVNEAFYNLYSITGDRRHLELAEFFYHNDVVDPLADGRDELQAKHANTFIPKVIGEARRYELTAEERSRGIAEYFWNTVIDHQTYCTGGNSTKEKFIEADKISENLTGYTQETCNTNNMLKLTRHLFCWTADSRYADYYERALYNHIIGQQDPGSGMVAYFLPLMAGVHKVYSTPEQSFWCCVGTGFENHSKYGEAIYYHTDNKLYVNLFIPSELNWRAKGVTVRQETKFPEDGKSKLTIGTSTPSRFAVKVRRPAWASAAEVKVNGRKVKVAGSKDGYITIERAWKNGDRIEVDYPMSLYTVAANDDPGKVALMYGPSVLAGVMGTDNMDAPAPFSDPSKFNDYYTYDYNVPANITTSLDIDKQNPQKSIVKQPGEPLVFTTSDGTVRFEPIWRIHRQRYVVYWDVK